MGMGPPLKGAGHPIERQCHCDDGFKLMDFLKELSA